MSLYDQILYIQAQHLTCCSRHVIWHERHWQRQTPCATGHQPGCTGTPQCGPVGLWYDSEDALRCAGHCSPAPGTCQVKASANMTLCIPHMVQHRPLHLAQDSLPALNHYFCSHKNLHASSEYLNSFQHSAQINTSLIFQAVHSHFHGSAPFKIESHHLSNIIVP